MVAMLECQSFVDFSDQRLRTGLVPNGPHPRLLCYLKRSTLGSLVTTQGEILGCRDSQVPMGWVANPKTPILVCCINPSPYMSLQLTTLAWVFATT